MRTVLWLLAAAGAGALAAAIFVVVTNWAALWWLRQLLTP